MVGNSLVRVFDAKSGEFKRYETGKAKTVAWKHDESLIIRLCGRRCGEIGLVRFPILDPKF